MDKSISLPDKPSAHASRGQCDHHSCRQDQRLRWVPPSPADHAFQSAQRASRNRFTPFETMQVIGQRRRTDVPPLWVFFQTFQADGFRVARNAGIKLRRPHWFLDQHLLQRCRRRVGAERRPAGEAFVQNCAQRVDVRRWPDRGFLAARLLRRHVARRADWSAGEREPRARFQPRQAKVRHLWRAIGG